MTHTNGPLRGARTRIPNERVPKRLRELAEAGATGRSLSPREVKEVCEALRVQVRQTPTHFHSGFG